MNWKRIWSGTVTAGIVLLLGEWAIIGIFHRYTGVPLSIGYFPGCRELAHLPKILFAGFTLMIMYVLARPRGGPGPKTAVAMGLAGGLLANLHLWPIYFCPPKILILDFVARIFACIVATYLAGWQYIEKAP